MTLDEITAYIATQDLNRVLDTNMFIGIMPPSDAINAATLNTVISLIEYGGRPSEHDLGTSKLRIVFPMVQILCRGVANDYKSPRLALETIVGFMAQVINQTLSGVYYLGIDAQGEPGFINRDENFRVTFGVNFQVTKRYSAT